MNTRTQQSRHNAPFVPAALGLLALSLLSSSAALAADEGWYAGGNYGETRGDVIDSRIIDALIGGGYRTQSLNDDEDDRGYKVFGGYQINENIALEGGYFSLGKFRYQAEMDLLTVVRGDTSTDGINLDLVGIRPVTERVSVFARAGAVYAQSRERRWETGSFINHYDHDRENDLSYKFGAGTSCRSGSTSAVACPCHPVGRFAVHLRQCCRAARWPCRAGCTGRRTTICGFRIPAPQR